MGIEFVIKVSKHSNLSIRNSRYCVLLRIGFLLNTLVCKLNIKSKFQKYSVIFQIKTKKCILHSPKNLLDLKTAMVYSVKNLIK